MTSAKLMFVLYTSITNVLGKYGELNGHVSPSSSCASEVANHMGDHISSPNSLISLSNRSLVSPSRGTSSDYLDSLLSKRLSQDPGLKLHLDQLESVSIRKPCWKYVLKG